MMQKPDPRAVLDGLKPFQRDTVEYVFDRLYMNPGSRRFLIADEVGLGKTLVARGVTAKAIEHLWDQVERIDVIYICSNADIARQNINRLNITGRQDFAHAKRITLLPKYLHSLDSKLNFVSFTPGTSFQLKSSLGTWEERILLYWLLRSAWDLDIRGLDLLMQGWVEDRDFWLNQLRRFPGDKCLDHSLASDFCQALELIDSQQSGRTQSGLKERLERVCFEYSSIGDPKKVPQDISRERNRLVGEIRAVLARTCISALEPDVVILDEFQRFKDLLDGDSDASRLARELLEYEDETTRVRTMLLSATPYKMYTLHGEDEDHYQDFLRTVAFLQNNTVQTRELKALLKEYRRALYQHTQDDAQYLFAVKQDIQARLQQVMARTERVYANGGPEMMTEVHRETIPQDEEILDYLAGQKLSEILGAGDYLEYWKSAPYLLSFMDEYKLKRTFEHFCSNGQHLQIASLMQSHPFLVLPWSDIQDFKAMNWRNAKIRSLVQETLGQGIWKLLWMPPALSYYQPQGPYADFIE
ncbi:MAG: helicase, partial [Desulfovermiculus sp.]